MLIHLAVWIIWGSRLSLLVVDERTMPRTARSCPGGYTYHVLNRGNARATVFHGSDDDEALLEVMAEASIRGG